MALSYRGVLTVHFSSSKAAEYNRLKNALVYAGWRWVDTGAFDIETDDLAKIWRGIDLAGRQSGDVGSLTGLTFHIQPSANGRGLMPPPTLSRSDAVDRILAKPFPQPAGSVGNLRREFFRR
jgi:hypothetical protein